MLKIRLQKIGKKNSPSFRVVLVEHTFRPQGKFIELLGSYNVKSKQKIFKKERILHWISKGAQLSPTMHNMLVNEKILDKAKVQAWKPKKRPVSAEAAAAKPAETPVETPVVAETSVAEQPKAEESKLDEQPKSE